MRQLSHDHRDPSSNDAESTTAQKRVGLIAVRLDNHVVHFHHADVELVHLDGSTLPPSAATTMRVSPGMGTSKVVTAGLLMK